MALSVDSKTQQEKVVPVETYQVSRGDITQEIELNVTFAPASTVPVVPKVSGTVQEVKVAVGDWVEKGQVLFTIEDRQYRLQVQQAEAAYEAAKANLAQLEKGASEEEIRQAEAAVAQAKASLAGAIKSLENAEQMLADRTQYKQQLQSAETQVELAKSQLEAAKSGVDQAEIAYENAETEYRRMQELFQKDMISRQQLDGVRLQYESAKASYESAVERLRQAEIGLDSAKESLELAQESYSDPISLVGQVDAAEAQVEVAKAGLAAAESRLAAVKKGATKEQLDAAKAQVKQAKTAWELAKLQLEYTQVTAPIFGQVAQLSVEEGGVVAPGNPGCVLVDTRTMEAEVFVPESYINKLSVGDQVPLTATALPGVTFYGTIQTISPMADTRTQQFPVKISVKNEDNQLKAGMFGTVTFVVGTEKDVLIVPVDAVLYDRGQPFVYTVEDGRAQVCEIEVGLESAGMIAVRSGLTEGAQVIIKGQHQVKNGSPVEVR
ncbi:MAG: efflux RND transporter periplasmic adaptor subunit [Firmicutes bacterium]|nr:efflux RND transporter periplasmic adaptor subunit [Bacillota bacterium]